MLPDPWQQTLERSLELIDELDSQIDRLELELAELGANRACAFFCVSVGG